MALGAIRTLTQVVRLPTHDPDQKARAFLVPHKLTREPCSPFSLWRSVGDCAPATGVCARDPRFRKGHEFTYWAPLEFEPGSGAVRTFRPFLDNVTLDLA